MKKREISNIVLSELIKEFYPEDSEIIDWMGSPITKKNKPTYHHIEKACDLKEKHKDYSPTLKNGAILGVKSHRKLNLLEFLDPDLYESWNYLFRVINGMGVYPIDDVWKMIYLLREKTNDLLYSEEYKKENKKERKLINRN